MQSILETPRLILRRFIMEDAPLLLELNSDPDVTRYLHEPPLTSLAEAERVLQEIILPQYTLYNLGRWAIHTKENNKFVGWCGLKYRLEAQEVDLGYRLHKRNWGKGFATEAASHTLSYGLDTLLLPMILGRAHIDNKASQHVLEKIGMQFVREEMEDDCQIRVYRTGKQ